MALNLNTFFGGGVDAPAGWKTVRYSEPRLYTLSSNSASPTRISCGGNQRIRILLLADGNSMSTGSTGSANKYKSIKLGSTNLLTSSQYLNSYRGQIQSGYLWWGSMTERANGIARDGSSSIQVLNPTTYTSSLGCPIGGTGEALSMYSTSSSTTYRKVWLAYEILQKM